MRNKSKVNIFPSTQTIYFFIFLHFTGYFPAPCVLTLTKVCLALLDCLPSDACVSDGLVQVSTQLSGSWIDDDTVSAALLAPFLLKFGHFWPLRSTLHVGRVAKHTVSHKSFSRTTWSPRVVPVETLIVSPRWNGDLNERISGVISRRAVIKKNLTATMIAAEMSPGGARALRCQCVCN